MFDERMQERKFRASWGSGLAEGRKVLFVKPLTYMNTDIPQFQYVTGEPTQ